MKLRKLLLPVFMFSFVSTSVYAVEPTGTLKKIKDNGVIIVGHRESSVPFSFYGDKQQVVGYSQEYSNLIVDAVKKELNMPNLKVKLFPINSQTRIPTLQNGSYDFECGSTTNNEARRQQVDFSNTIFIINTRLLVKKDSNVKGLEDLKGKNVVVTSGTTSDVLLHQLNDEKKLNIRIILAKDHNASFKSLEMGRAAAFLMDDVLLAGERAKSSHPENWVIVGEPLSREAYGCMLRKGDEQFKALMDKTIADAQTSGQAEKFYQRWFIQPISSQGVNLNFELSDDMKQLFKSPNDKSLD